MDGSTGGLQTFRGRCAPIYGKRSGEAELHADQPLQLQPLQADLVANSSHRGCPHLPSPGLISSPLLPLYLCLVF